MYWIVDGKPRQQINVGKSQQGLSVRIAKFATPISLKKALMLKVAMVL